MNKIESKKVSRKKNIENQGQHARGLVQNTDICTSKGMENEMGYHLLCLYGTKCPMMIFTTI